MPFRHRLRFIKTFQIILILAWVSILSYRVYSQPAIPSTKLVPHVGRTSGLMWMETIKEEKVGINGVNSYKYTVKGPTDRHTGESQYSYETSTMFPKLKGTTSTIQICYCDGTPVLVADFYQSNTNLLENRQTAISAISSNYNDIVKSLCYSLSRNIPTSTDVMKAEVLFQEAMNKTNELSSNQRLDLLNHATSLVETNGQYQYERGKLYYDKEFYLDAAICFQNSIVAQYQMDSSYYYKGKAFYTMKHYRQAAVALSETTRLNPNFRSAWYYQAESFIKDRNFAEALYGYLKVIEITNIKSEKDIDNMAFGAGIQRDRILKGYY